MKRKWFFTTTISIVAVLLLLTGCGQDGSEEVQGSNADDANGHYKIAMVLKTLSTEYWHTVIAGAEDAAKEFGVEVEFLGPTQEIQYEEQIKIVEDQIVSGANAIIVAPSQAEAVLPVLNNAHGQDIPVILADTDADFEDKSTFVGTHNFEAGKLGGEYLSDKLEAGDKVAIIRGPLGSNTHDDRTKGFQEALKDRDIEFIIQDANSDRAKAVNIMENILTANPDVKYVFATSDEMALGAITALENNSEIEIPVIGFDGTPDGLNAVKNGIMLANVAQNPYMIGYLSVESAYHTLQGKDVEKRIDSGANVITQDNVDETIEEINGYLGK
ncbi:sugar ABC transporter substrate-binding protein [Oceanobacillus profundus]|uniref:sugar ABC transporter substrate-binding protein n=1 Tax=Oceanobacillus profundus TaxID=372463 RepID=UPI00204095C8|nr:sugar ABC transporter substrate-binding protein [Oceanobacillus profundus]MCM3399531.1 sugar ABC transporter substrate-binding protein [Oceanobacillus profundus]